MEEGFYVVELQGYLRALRKLWLVVVLTTLAGLGIAATAYFLTAPVYASRVTFYVSTPLSEGSNPLSAGQFAQARVNSYVGLLESEQLAQRVIAAERLALTPQQVTNRIEATAQLNTVLVTAEVRDADRLRSLAVAKGIANTFPGMVDQLDNKGRSADVVIITAVSGPTLAANPVAPNPLLYAGLGLLGGLLLGAAIAVAREALDNTVRTNAVATDLVGAPVLGVIDLDPDAVKSPLVLAGTPASGRSESFRQLRTNLQFIDAAKTAEVLMVTSAVAGEGKSLTAVNLGISFTGLGQKVLLVDADLRRPALGRYLGVENEVGLSGVLAGSVKLEDAVQPWGTDGLHVLPSGQQPPNPAELLGSKAMSDLVSKVRTDYDKVIIDTPPLLPVTDAALASAAADGVVVVVRWGKTHRSQVSGAVESLRQVDARILGSVLNQRRLSRRERQHYAAEGYYSA